MLLWTVLILLNFFFFVVAAMGDSEFDSFFEDTPAGDAPVEAPTGEDPFAGGAVMGGDEAPAFGGDFGGDSAPQVADAPMAMGGGDVAQDMGDMSSAFVTSANLSESPALT